MCPCPKTLRVPTFLRIYGIARRSSDPLPSATDAGVKVKSLPEPSHAITPAPPCLTNTNAVHFHFLSHNPCLHAKRGDFPPPPYQGAMKIDVLRMRHQLVRRGHSGHRAIAPACLMSHSSIHVLPDCPARQPMWMHICDTRARESTRHACVIPRDGQAPSH